MKEYSEFLLGAQACVVAFSTTDRDSFNAIESWKQKVEEEVGPNIPTCLVQNKIDLIDNASISQYVADCSCYIFDQNAFQLCYFEILTNRVIYKTILLLGKKQRVLPRD